jgi:hypothetical protein
MPFTAPNDLLSTAQYKYLSIQQVIQDTAAVLAYVRKDRAVPDAVPAVVIGGSYGEVGCSHAACIAGRMHLQPTAAYSIGAAAPAAVLPDVYTL